MTQKDNILNELQELNSKLAGMPNQNVYTVPVGYFEGLAAQVLNRIKAMQAADVAEELGHLSTVLNKVSKDMPYEVPQGYFEGLAKNVLNAVSSTAQSPADELKEISPFLSGLKKETPFAVPQGYFDSLTEKTPADTNKPVAKVVSFTSRKWFRYAVAAVVTGVILLGSIMISRNNNPERSLAKFEKKLNNEIKKTSDKELTDFIQQFSGNETNKEDVAYNVPDTEIKELLKDVSETELKQFLDETSDAEAANTDAEETIFVN